jgi:predicted thioesterase
VKRKKARKTPALRPGLAANFTRIVLHEWTIAHYDERLPAVLSTPAMIAMMETAAALAIRPRLAKGTISVGTRIEVDHLKAAPEGARVRAHARLTGIKGRFLAFDVEALAGRELLGRGRVFRAVVETAPFFAKASARDGKPEKRTARTGKSAGKKR